MRYAYKVRVHFLAKGPDKKIGPFQRAKVLKTIVVRSRFNESLKEAMRECWAQEHLCRALPELIQSKDHAKSVLDALIQAGYLQTNYVIGVLDDP